MLKHKLFNRAMALLLALTCVLGLLPLSAFAAAATAPTAITQKSANYMYVGGKPVRYESASDTINAEGHPYVFNAQVDVPSFGATRALCAYQKGTLGNGANGQRWNFKTEVTHSSLKALLTWV